MNGSWDAYLVSPADFAGEDDIITNLVKEREPGIEIIDLQGRVSRLEILKCMWRLVNPVFVFCLNM